MSEQELRLECLKWAADKLPDLWHPNSIMALAESYFQYVVSGLAPAPTVPEERQ